MFWRPPPPEAMEKLIAAYHCVGPKLGFTVDDSTIKVEGIYNKDNVDKIQREWFFGQSNPYTAVKAEIDDNAKTLNNSKTVRDDEKEVTPRNTF